MIRGRRLPFPGAFVTAVLIAGTASFADRTLVDIIVAQNIKSELQPKLDRLAADLRNEGYTSRITSWPAGKSSEDVWTHLKEGYDNDNLQGGLLVGHVPVYSYPVQDPYVPGKTGTTDNVYWNMASYAKESADAAVFFAKARPKHIWVSRLYAPSNSGYGDEAELLTNALDANHDYRTGRSRLSHKAFTHSCINRNPGEPDACRGHRFGENWAEIILDTWPETQALYAQEIDDVMFQNGGDFLFVQCHGLSDRYAEDAITTRKVFSRGCGIRAVIAQSCITGALGGVLNTQTIADGTRNIISAGFSVRAYGGELKVMVERGASPVQFRQSILNGVPWGKAMLRDYPFQNQSVDRLMIYGDLSLPSMMYPAARDVPAKAGDPSPAPHEQYVHPSRTILRWISRVGTNSHDVYFGTDSTPDETEFRGNQDETTFDVSTLAQGTTYYWRVDERNAHGKTVGHVWSFTTEKDSVPHKAARPAPENGETDMCRDTALHWSAGAEARSFDVYLEAGNSSPDALVAEGIEERIFFPGKLDHNRTYFWRVDVKNGFGTTTKGDVWSFTTEEKGPKKLYTNLDTGRCTSDNHVYGVGFTIEKPIRITAISVDNLLNGSKNNVAIWRVGNTTPLHVFSMENSPVQRNASQAVDIVLPEGTYRMAALFKEHHQSWISRLHVACGIKDLRSVGKNEGTRLQYPDFWSDATVRGHVNFAFVQHGDDVVETVLSPEYRKPSPGLSYTRRSILIPNGMGDAGVIAVRMIDLRGRTVWEKIIEPMGETEGGVSPRRIPLPVPAHAAYIVTVSSPTTLLRKGIMVVR